MMDEIFRHLHDEIDSLNTLLRHTENKLLAKSWTTALLDPFEKFESEFETAETRRVVTALHEARTTHGVNSDLADRIDTILLRHEHLPRQEETSNDISAEPVEMPRPVGKETAIDTALPPHDRRHPTRIDIFAHRISLADMVACLDVTTEGADAALMDQKLRLRQDDGIIQALENHEHAEGRYILLPRIGRINRDGHSLPCTVRVKLYPRLFGDTCDLVSYRGDPLIEFDTPEPGWAIIQPESVQETLGRTYDEQNQAVRIMGPGVGLPSHVVRRRTLVEAVFDMVVCRLALNIQTQRDTADWTGSGSGRKSHTSVIFTDGGIRIRDLPGSTKHGILGCCPTW